MTSRIPRHHRTLLALVLAATVLVASIPAGSVGVATAAGNSSAQSITTCGPISSPGVYELTANLDGTGVPQCLVVESSDVTIDGNGRLIDGNAVGGNRAIVVTAGSGAADNVTVSNVRLARWETGVFAQDTTDVTLSGVKVTDGLFGVQATSSSVDVYNSDVSAVTIGFDYADLSAPVTVADSVVTDTAGHGIRVRGATAPVTVKANEITDTQWSAVTIEDAVGIDVRDNDVLRASLDASTITEAINLTNASGTVTGNTVTDVSQGGVGSSLLHDGSLNVTGNGFTNVAYHGVQAVVAPNLTVTDNEFDVTGYSAVRIDAVNEATISNNTVTGSNAADADSPAIDVEDSNATLADDDVDTDHPGDGITVTDSNVTITGGEIDAYHGIHLTRSTGYIEDTWIFAGVAVKGDNSEVTAERIDVPSAGSGFWMQGGNATLRDSFIDATGGVYGGFYANVTVDNVTVDSASEAVRSDADAEVTVLDSNLTADDLGVEVKRDANVTVRNTSIESGGHGFDLREGSNATISGVTIDADAIGVNSTESPVTVEDTVIDASHRGLVTAVSPSPWTVSNVTIRNASMAIDHYITEMNVTGLTVEGSSVGLWATGASDVNLANATIEASSHGLHYHHIHGVLSNVSVVGPAEGIEIDANSEIDATAVTIDATETAVLVERDANLELLNGSVESDDVGVFVEDASTQFSGYNLTVAAPVGIDVGPTVGDETGAVGVAFADLNQTTIPIRNAASKPVTASLTYFGPRGPVGVEGAVSGTDPFLIDAPRDVNVAELQEFAIDLEMPAGRVYSLGTPGAMESTLGEAFDDFEGAIYLYNATAQSWELADGTERLDALEAVVVVPETDARVVVDFRDATPAQPTARTLETGWQFVSPRSYATAEQGFDTSRTLEAIDLLNLYELPDGQPANPNSEYAYRFTSHEFQELMYGDVVAPTTMVSPYGGYFVYVTAESTVPARVPNGVTVEELAEMLGLDQSAWFGPYVV